MHNDSFRYRLFAITSSFAFRFFGIFFLSAVILVLASSRATTVAPEPDDIALAFAEPWLDTSDRETVLAFYEQAFSQEPAPMEWSGSHELCEPGSSSSALAKQTIDRVNYYRAMAGVSASITEETVYSAKAQHAAVSMSAEGELSHTPDESFACLNDFVVEAAANSNLYLGRSGAWAVDGYIEDPGDGNLDVGHRNTILHPPTKKMGVGHSSADTDIFESNILWVFDDHVFDSWPDMRETEQFVAWPPRGYVPASVVYPRWSFSLKEADFSEATVSMAAEGENVSLEVVKQVSEKGQVPAPVIVWEPGILFETETSFTVTVANVFVDGIEKSYTYTVTLLV